MRQRGMGIQKLSKSWPRLTENPNVPDNNGKTASSVAKNAEICGILESFNTSRKCKSGSSTKPSKKRAKNV